MLYYRHGVVLFVLFSFYIVVKDMLCWHGPSKDSMHIGIFFFLVHDGVHAGHCG